jgi:hypothetical protein
MTLAAKVAAEVMRWPVCRDAKCEGCEHAVFYCAGEWTVNAPKPGRPTWDPIANPADLLDVLGELQRHEFEVDISVREDNVYAAVREGGLSGEIIAFHNLTPRGANTWQLCLARAVCRAAIEAVKSQEGG